MPDHKVKISISRERRPWWRSWNDYPNPTLDAVLALFVIAVIVMVFWVLLMKWRKLADDDELTFAPTTASSKQRDKASAGWCRQNSDCGLISAASPLVINNRNLIISLAARHRLPAIYPFPFFVAHGALICFGPDPIDPHRKAAGYVDRILKGEKPADLPVQAATKFELVINLKTAKALGLTVISTAPAMLPNGKPRSYVVG
jgi:ABC-type uncharacterized transport system substrate-binding protein